MRRNVILGTGDALVFLIFAWTGRSSHHETAGTGAGALGAVMGTAAPFLAAWFAVAALLRTYRPREGGGARGPTGRAAVTWVVAWPVGLALRAVTMRRGIPPSFAAITLIVNMVLLLAWRGLANFLLDREERRRSAEAR